MKVYYDQIKDIQKDVRAVNALPLKAVKKINGHSSLNSKKVVTKTFYSTTGKTLLKAVIKDVYPAKSALDATTITTTFYFKDDKLIMVLKKTNHVARSRTVDFYFKDGQPLPIGESPMEREYLIEAKNLLREFK